VSSRPTSTRTTRVSHGDKRRIDRIEQPRPWPQDAAPPRTSRESFTSHHPTSTTRNDETKRTNGTKKYPPSRSFASTSVRASRRDPYGRVALRPSDIRWKTRADLHGWVDLPSVRARACGRSKDASRRDAMRCEILRIDPYLLFCLLRVVSCAVVRTETRLVKAEAFAGGAPSSSSSAGLTSRRMTYPVTTKFSSTFSFCLCTMSFVEHRV